MLQREDGFVKGKCMTMCPEKETRMREKEKLLHSLEMVKTTIKSKHPKADRNCVVKEFSRSAAGKIIDEHNVRPFEVLLKTINYLLFDVVNTDYLPWRVIYDFITDRFMAVRQDMVVQNLSSSNTIRLLEPIVRFHILAAYKLCLESRHNFDPVLNNKHIQECLKKLLQAYDHVALRYSNNNHRVDVNRAEFEAIYVVFNMGNDEALRRALSIHKKYRTNLLNHAFSISLCYQKGNFVRACRLIQTLPVLLAALASTHLPQLQRRAFDIMTTAYNSKILHYPAEKIKSNLLYDQMYDVYDDCEYYGVTVEKENNQIHFLKHSFKKDKTPRPLRRLSFIDKQLEADPICDLLITTSQNIHAI